MEAKKIVTENLKKISIGVNKIRKILKFSTKNRKNKMRNFDILDNKLEILGLRRPDPNDKSNILKYKCLAISFYLGVITILSGIPICSLGSIKEFVIGCYGFLVVFAIFIHAILLYYLVPTIHSLMDNFNEVIQKRGFNKLF